MNKTPVDLNLEKLNESENNDDINDYVTPKSPKVAKSKQTESLFTAKDEIFTSKSLEKQEKNGKKIEKTKVEVELIPESDNDSDDGNFI